MSSKIEKQLLAIEEELKRLRREVAVPKKLYSREDAAVALSVSLSKVKQLIREGRILTTEIDGRRLIHVSEIDRIAQPTGTASKPRTSGGRPKTNAPATAPIRAADIRALTRKR